MTSSQVNTVLGYVTGRDDTSRFAVKYDVLPSRIRQRNRRFFYAATPAVARQMYLQFMRDKNRRLGVSELPPEARLRPEDLAIAAREQPILPHPQSHDQVKNYLGRLYHSPLYQNIVNKLKSFVPYSPAGDKFEWSNGQFVDPAMVANIPNSDYHQIYKSIYSHLPPARQRIHDQAMSQSLNPRARVLHGEDKNFVMLLGSPGAGKTTHGHPEARAITPNFTTINVDDMRDYLPEYQGWNSGPIHKEAAYMTYGPLMHQAYDQHHHILYDATGANQKTMEATLQGAQERGYKTHLILVHRPSYKSVAGTWDRFLDNPYGAKLPGQKPSRFVDPGWAYEKIQELPLQTYQNLKTTPLVHSFTKLNSDVPRGQPAIVEEKSYDPRGTRKTSGRVGPKVSPNPGRALA